MVSLSPAEEVRCLLAAGDRPLATWMREAILAAAPSITESADGLARALDVYRTS